MDTYKFKKTLLALSITAVLSACGGGSDEPVVTGPDTVTGVQLAGTAAKGIIINGLVTAQELNTSGAVLRSVGTAITNASGRYSLTLDNSYEGGPIRVEVTKDASTTMVCDATTGCGTRTDGLTDTNNPTAIDFGEQYKPASLTMSALLPQAADNEAIDVQITPFTHMAAARALTSTTLNAAAINNANSEVSSLLGGIDILRTEPVDITSSTSFSNASASAQVYAALNASIAELATDDADGQPDINQALTTFSTGFAGGTISATSLQDIVVKAQAALDQVSGTDTSGVLAGIQQQVDAAGTDGNVDPEPSASAGDTNVAKAKAFIQDLTTWGVTIGGELDAPSAAFETQLDMAGKASDMIQNDGSGDAIGLGAMAIVSYFDGTIQNLTEFTDVDSSTNPFTAGTLASTTTTAGVEYSITGCYV